MEDRGGIEPPHPTKGDLFLAGMYFTAQSTIPKNYQIILPQIASAIYSGLTNSPSKSVTKIVSHLLLKLRTAKFAYSREALSSSVRSCSCRSRKLFVYVLPCFCRIRLYATLGSTYRKKSDLLLAICERHTQSLLSNA